MLKIVVFAAGLAGLAGVAAAEDVVTGSAVYRERIAMPENAVFVAELVERLSGDIVAGMRREKAGNPPYAFRIVYDPAKIEDRLGYGVRASVLVDGTPVFTTIDMPDVITRGAPREVMIVMRKAP
ncbi:MAG: YbaY family lipoprotein [Parvibaculaceae bacterium]|jgi:putative lipoprotein